MTDRKQALTDLLEKVEAGSFSGAPYLRGLGGNNGQEKEAMSSSGLMDYASGITHAFRGSLDAAKALHEAVLPEWGYCDHLRRGMRYTVYIAKSVEDESVDAVSNCPARAWLIAILKALIAKEDKE